MLEATPLTEAPDKLPRWPWIVAAAFLSMILKLAFATRRGFWLDEYYTLNAVQMSVSDLVQDRLGAGHSPLPFLYAKLFHTFLGTDEWSLRVSSALGAGLAVVGLGALARALRLGALLPVLLVMAVVQPYWQDIGREFRYTMPLVGLGATAAAFLVRWIETMKARWGLALGATLSVALLWHGSAQFIGVAFVLFVVLAGLWTGERATRLRRIGVGLLPILAAFAVSVPLLLLISRMKNSDEDRAPGVPSLRIAFTNQVQTVFGEDRALESFGVPLLGDVLVLPVLGCYAVALWACFRWLRRNPGEPERRLSAFLVATLLGLPAVVVVYTALFAGVQGPERYVAFLSIPGMIVVAIGWGESARWKPAGRALWRGALCVAYPALFLLASLDQGDWHRECSRWMAANRRPEEPIVTMGRGMNEVGLRYHGLAWVGDIRGVRSDRKTTDDLEAAIRSAMATADTGWLFLYRPGKADSAGLLEELKTNGFLLDYHRREFTRDMALVLMIRSEEARGRFAALDEIPGPWITSKPVRDRD